MNYAVYEQQPQDFQVEVQAAGCYFACQGKFLLLKRHSDTRQGNTWGTPAGKLEPGENPKMAVIREIQEEVGLDISEQVSEVGKLYIRHSHSSYIYHMFYTTFCDFPEIRLDLNEHVEARWVTFEEAQSLPLIMGGIEVLHYYQRYLDGAR
jgi:8-oxo-dGTP pyrophosphatase MutT (NUDIX family)